MTLTRIESQEERVVGSLIWGRRSVLIGKQYSVGRHGKSKTPKYFKYNLYKEDSRTEDM